MIFADEVKITKNENSIEYNIVCHDYVDYIFPIYSRNLYSIKCTVEIYDENNKRIHIEENVIINSNDDCIVLKEFAYKFFKNIAKLQKTDIPNIYKYKIFTKQTIDVEYSNMTIEGECIVSKCETPIGTNFTYIFLKPHKNKNGIKFKIVEFN